jgi:hypothetical protein
MGGHGVSTTIRKPSNINYMIEEGSHISDLKIPSYKKYKIENAPELESVQKRLAAKGIKDPWLRYFNKFLFLFYIFKRLFRICFFFFIIII